ncbi:eukaryotic translation initiation factor-like [Capsicum annuum]|uniref:eukaryotic translation initiation factor-like n=1 Tax=Capsicum annuum TaxID=4072 RepID=UPI001FB18194|nr:eukaryotic translation initiation factor-like [Capsicum annuum]
MTDVDKPHTGDSCFEGREGVMYTRDQLLQLREQEVESELFVGGRGRADANVICAFCVARSCLMHVSVGAVLDRSLKPSFVTQGGSTRMLIKAETPRSAAQKSNFFDKDHVLNTVMGYSFWLTHIDLHILNPPTVTKFDLLKRQLIASAITNADTLKDVVSLIFNSAVLEPTFCPMYAQLFSDLSENLPPFPSDEPGGRKISFKRVLLNNCQEAFEGAEKLRDEVRQMIAPEQESEQKDIEKFFKLRNLGNIKLIGELFNIRMVTESIVRRIVQELLEQDPKSCPEEEKVEAICQFFNIIGKQLDENNNSRNVNDMYFNRLKQLSTNPQLVPRLRFMVRDVMDLRSNNWVPRREEVKAKSIAEFHSKAQKTLSSRPGASARMRNCRGPPAQGSSRWLSFLTMFLKSSKKLKLSFLVKMPVEVT